MWDEDRDKEMMRNQMLAIVLMTVLMMGWWYFFAPQPLPPAPDAPQTVAFDEPFDPQSPTLAAVNDSVDRSPEPAGVWPYLPPLPVQSDPALDELTITDGENLELVFTRIGGRLKRATVLIGDEAGGNAQLIPEFDGLSDLEAVYPLGLRFTHESIGDDLDRRRFEGQLDPDRKGVTFTLALGDVAEIRKHFRFAGPAHVLNITIDYVNKEPGSRIMGRDLTPAFLLNWGPTLHKENEGRYFQPAFVWRTDIETLTLPPKDLPELPELKRILTPRWVGFKSKYFLAAFKADFEGADAWIQGVEDDFRFGLTAPRFELASGETHRNAYSLYLGPVELGSLGDAWDTLPEALSFFTMFHFMDTFAKFLLSILNWFHAHLFANYGVAIILLTVLVRAIMYPLTLKSMRSMKRMQALAPEVEALKEKYKDDQQEASRKMMELYRERGVNPLGGCLPMFLQMPIFIALYRMLWYAFELRGAPFLWVEDLSRPDHLFRLPFMGSLPFVGEYLEYFNLLPILMGAAMVLSMKLMPTSGAAQNPQQKMMMTMMPLIFSVFCYPLAAGLNLYVLTSTILGMVQQHFVRATVTTEKENARITKREDVRKKRKQNFYTRAKEHQRQVVKNAKRAKKIKRKSLNSNSKSAVASQPNSKSSKGARKSTAAKGESKK